MKLNLTEKELILKSRQKLKLFFNDVKAKSFKFKADCRLPVRIKFIYSIIFPGLKKYFFYHRFLVARIAQYSDISWIKVFLYRLIGVKIGKGVFISPDVIIDPHFPSLIEIKDYAILGWGSQLFPHEFSSNTYRIGKITICKGAVIGAFSIIRGGVEIGENAEVSSLSIVYKDVPENYLVDSAVVLKKALVETYRKNRL